jgi:ferritin-like metal-binding protein YciE
MADPNERDAKLVQYLNEAYTNERELETALQADLLLTTKPAYAKRLKQHLKETKSHAKALERRIKKLGGGGHAVQSVIAKAAAVAKAVPHAVRGSGAAEKMLKNAKTQFVSEQEEISTYLAIETFATKVGDKETASLARAIRKEEERMARFLEGQIKQLSGAVAIDEVPASQRRRSSANKAKRAAAKPSSKKAAAKSPSKKAAPKSKAKRPAKKAPKRSTKKAPAKKASAKKSTAKKASGTSAKKAR